MGRVEISRLAVLRAETSTLEGDAKRLVASVAALESGPALIAFARRSGPASGLFPAIQEALPEYIRVVASADESGRQEVLESVQAEGSARTIVTSESFDEDGIVVGYARKHDWTAKPPVQFALNRFRLKEEQAAEFEEAAARYVRIAVEREPGSLLWLLLRRSVDGSSLAHTAPSRSARLPSCHGLPGPGIAPPSPGG
jgi:hypothetical protein